MTEPKIKGVLKTWKADRGFGFIKPDNGGKDIFIHISSLNRTNRRPVRGDIISYQIAKDNQGKFKAVNAAIVTTGSSNQKVNNFFNSNKRALAILIGLSIAVIAAVFFYMIYQ